MCGDYLQFWGSHRHITVEEKEVLEAEGLPIPRRLPFSTVSLSSAQ